jgi:hypothetical protein
MLPNTAEKQSPRARSASSPHLCRARNLVEPFFNQIK